MIGAAAPCLHFGYLRHLQAGPLMTPPSHSAEPQRLAFLESIRGLAAVQVVLLHFFSAFRPDMVFESASGSPAWYVHLSPLSFLYDGHSAVYIFFVLSGYVLSRSFERHLEHPLALISARALRLGLPAIVAVLAGAAAIKIFGRPNIDASAISGSEWFSSPHFTELSMLSIIRDGVGNALFLGYRDLPGVAFLAPWQQPIDQSFVPPLWTLSIEFYGSLAVLLLSWFARRSRHLWWAAIIMATIFTIRSAYLCFVVGHLLANWHRAEKPAPANQLLPAIAAALGVFLCVRADIWQFEWLRKLCSEPTFWLFPGQTAAPQQKALGAILVLTGLIHLQWARSVLSWPWLVRNSRLSFPVYLVHWPILFGPAALIFLWLNGIVGLGLARACAIVTGIGLVFLAGLLFSPVDRAALSWSRRLRGKLSGLTMEMATLRRTTVAHRAVPAE
jgi:peptidoglycan/LPS O-acetylase OafA/YrhL